jgi:hypothetical protein
MSPEHAEAVGALVRATSRKLTITLGGSTVFYDRAEETYPILP